MSAFVDRTKIHQGPGSLWLACAIPATGSRLLVDAGGNPTASGLGAPSAPGLLAVVGGIQPAATYYVIVTYLNVFGESLPSPEASFAVPASNFLGVQSPTSVSGATSYNVYAGVASGGERLQNPSPILLGQSWTAPATGILSNGPQPPASNNSGPVFAGAISGATTFVWTPKVQPLGADQVPAPIDVRMTAEEQTIETEIMETDYAKLRAYMTSGIYSAGSDPGLPAGFQSYEEISFGGLMTVPRLSVAVISPRIDAPGKFVVSQLYNAYQAQALSIPFSREKPTTVKVKFSGLADPSRPPGDQVGKIYRQP